MELAIASPATGYPRPLLQRDGWATLDGAWDFVMDEDAIFEAPSAVPWKLSRTIRVPFSPETSASGIGNTGLHHACWYRRTLEPIAARPTERIILHFGAVDYEAAVWIDDKLVVEHQGGYTPFEIDITEDLAEPRPHLLTVRAADDPSDLAKPRGKQDWQLEPHSIWYPRTTGIWQTVWLEIAPRTRIQALRTRTSLDRWEIELEAEMVGPQVPGSKLEVTMKAGAATLASDSYAVVGSEVTRAVLLSDPGVDDSRNELLWSPYHPTLISIDLRLVDSAGKELDVVRSYTALRSVSADGDRLLLNGRPFPFRLVLDQGYWPGTGLTPPSDLALRDDVQLAKAMGFTGVRKHQKVEDPRYLYWADLLGLLVWEEMPSAYRFTKRSVTRLTQEWIAVIERDRSHPCIMAWVPFNESWGVPNLPQSASERDFVRALYHLTKTLDPTRPVIGNDGWESVATDIIGVHDYDDDLERFGQRYRTEEERQRLFKRERPGGRLLVLGQTETEHPLVLSEFGGIAFAAEGSTWGYSRCNGPEDFASRYAALLATVHSLGLFSGFCYTQFADTYQEANGLLHADRTPKFAIEAIAAATRGTSTGRRLLNDPVPGLDYPAFERSAR